MSRIIAGGQAPLELTDFGPGQLKAQGGGGRWRARLRGRSCGGYLVGRGDDIRAAIEDLRRDYRQELAAIDKGELDLIDMGIIE